MYPSGCKWCWSPVYAYHFNRFTNQGNCICWTFADLKNMCFSFFSLHWLAYGRVCCLIFFYFPALIRLLKSFCQTYSASEFWQAYPDTVTPLGSVIISIIIIQSFYEGHAWAGLKKGLKFRYKSLFRSNGSFQMQIRYMQKRTVKRVNSSNPYRVPSTECLFTSF